MRKASEHHETEDQKHAAIVESKKNWYYRNKDRQRVQGLIYYYKKVLEKDPHNDKAQAKLDELTEKLAIFPLHRLNQVKNPPVDPVPKLRFKHESKPESKLESEPESDKSNQNVIL